ncbi:MAG TPA: hypothetical protein VFP05_04890 [Thermomicrobiales bacterium]|jgi:hypothetical protein|nr:hypothetical protein [Thermomicrobiales bacterium]
MANPAFNIEILDHAEETEQPRRLRTLGRVIPWPHQPKPRTDGNDCGTGVLAKAEIRTKRFIDHRRVEEERYDAEVFSGDSSLHSVMQALTKAFSDMEEFMEQRPVGEPLTMEIRLRV